MISNAKIFARIVAFISGIFLGNALAYIAGYLAAIAIPREYFLWFGKHTTVALFILDTFTFLVPFFVISMIWGILTTLVFRTLFLSTAAWCASGCLLAMLYLLCSDGPGISIYISSLKAPAFLLLSLLHLTIGSCGVLAGGYFLSGFRQSERELSA